MNTASSMGWCSKRASKSVPPCGHRHPRNIQRSQLAQLAQATGSGAHRTYSSPAPAAAARPTWPAPSDTPPACRGIARGTTAYPGSCWNLPKPRPMAATTSCSSNWPRSSSCSSTTGASSRSSRPTATTSWAEMTKNTSVSLGTHSFRCRGWTASREETKVVGGNTSG